MAGTGCWWVAACQQYLIWPEGDPLVCAFQRRASTSSAHIHRPQCGYPDRRAALVRVSCLRWPQEDCLALCCVFAIVWCMLVCLRVVSAFAHATPPPPQVRKHHFSPRTPPPWSRQTQHGLGVCIWMQLVNGTGNSPSPGHPTPGVVKQDKSSGGSVDITKTRSDPQRVRMSSRQRQTIRYRGFVPIPPPPRALRGPG